MSVGEFVLMMLCSCMTILASCAILVTRALLRGEITIQMLPSDEIMNLYRLIQSIPGFSRLRKPDEIAAHTVGVEQALEGQDEEKS